MSRTFSDRLTEGMAGEEYGDALLPLVQIDHDSLDDPIRLVANEEAVTSNGDTYQAYPFDLRLPELTDNDPRARLTVDNTDRLLVQTLRSIESPPTVTIRLVLWEDPDTIELEMGPLRLEQAQMDLERIQCRLGGEPWLYEPFPQHTYTPAAFPALF
ncbi:MAG: DUF1833 family protein [Thiohalospira sp.]